MGSATAQAPRDAAPARADAAREDGVRDSAASETGASEAGASGSGARSEGAAPAAPPALQTQAQAQPIPFRSESDVGTGQVIGALLLVVLALAALSAALHLARRRGVLARWLPGMLPGMLPGIFPAAAARAQSGDGAPPLQVERALRLSPRTTVYRIRDGERRWLLVESQVHARFAPCDGDGDTTDAALSDP